MLFLTATCGVIQAIFLPGFLITSYFIKEKNPLRFLTFSFALSLCVSYTLTFTLVTLGLFTQTVLFTLFGLQCLLVIPLIRQFTIPKSIQFCRDQVTQNYKFILYFIAFIFIFRSTNCIIREAGTVFTVWDAVVSWNRWALDLYAGSFPNIFGVYPQLVPATSATIYIMAGQEIQLFATFAQTLYILFAQLALFSFLKGKNAIAFLLTGMALYPLLKAQYIGYADVPVMCAVIFSATALLCWIENKKPTYFVLAFTLACFACVTKQAALVWLPFLFIIAYTTHKDAFLQIFKTKAIFILFCVICMTLSSYIFHLYIAFTENYSITAGTIAPSLHEGRSYFERFLHATTLDNQLFIGFLCALPLLFFKKYRYWALMGITYYIAWGSLLSYDTRNAMLSFPFLTFFTAMILQTIIIFILQKLSTISRLQKLLTFCPSFTLYNPQRYIYALSLIVICFFAYTASKDGAYTGKSFSTANIIAKDTTARMYIGYKEVNVILLDAMEKYNVPVISEYSIGDYLPGMKEADYTQLHDRLLSPTDTFKKFIDQNEKGLALVLSYKIEGLLKMFPPNTTKILEEISIYHLILYSKNGQFN